MYKTSYFCVVYKTFIQGNFFVYLNIKWMLLNDPNFAKLNISKEHQDTNHGGTKEAIPISARD